jgi:hypothetical protein
VIKRVAILGGQATLPQSPYALALQKGFVVHGIDSELYELRCLPKEQVVACWGWRRGQWLLRCGKTVLVAERGYLGDRAKWVGMGWNGLNGRATHTEVDDQGGRLNSLFPGLLEPWRETSSPGLGVALILGQVRFDSAVMHTDIAAWYRKVAKELEGEGYKIRFRAHPQDPKANPFKERHPLVPGELKDSLAGVSLAVTFNSTAGVDCVMAGVPTVTYDRGSMAWEMTTHTVKQFSITPEREKWAAALAWKQWCLEEISSGAAWETLQHSMPVQYELPAAKGARA